MSSQKMAQNRASPDLARPMLKEPHRGSTPQFSGGMTMTYFKLAAGGTIWMLVATLMLFSALEPVTTPSPAAAAADISIAARCAAGCDAVRL
jgi:hypothetical protein